MANTLKLGAGKWATGTDTVLAFNDENNNFKPLPFSFSRASSATVVNQSGLIETVGSGEPRIDFLGNTKGALLLEPQRTNKVIYEDFTQWTNYNASAVLSDETIYGKNAYKIVEDSTLNYHGLYLRNLFTANGTNYIWSVYVKGGERRYVVLTGRGGIANNDSAVIFDTQDGVWALDSSSQNQAFSAESVGNGWWRIAIEGNPTSSAYDSYTIAASLGGTTYTDANYQGDGTSGIYVAMAQVEEGSYATSYIPTSGSAVTRVADVCNNGANAQVINSTEGVLYAEIAALGIATNKYINIYQDANNRILLWVTSTGIIRGYAIVNSSGSDVFIDTVGVDATNNNKIALRWQDFTLSLFVNGVKIGNSTVTNSFSTMSLTTLDLKDVTSANFFYGNTKDVRVYNTALTDQEAIALTTI
jgi:hypothetical protein